MPDGLTQPLMRGSEKLLTGTTLSAQSYSTGTERAPGRQGAHENLKGNMPELLLPLFNCRGRLAHCVTPPQPITGDDQHLPIDQGGEKNMRRVCEGAANS